MDDRLMAAAAAEHLPPGGGAGAGAPGAGAPGGASATASLAEEAAGSTAGDAFDLADPRVLQILSTEHWSLLSARSLVYNEAFARAGMFLTFLSASLVALAFVANAMAFNRQFLVLAAIMLFVDIAIGLATLGRMLDASVDDLRSIAGMNRIRNAYVQVAPAVAPFLSAGTHDDSTGVLETYGDPRIRTGLTAVVHGLTTAGGMVLVIDALLGAALGSVVAIFLGADMAGAFAAAGVAFVALFLILNRYAYGVISGFEATFVSRFPTPPAD